MSGEIKGSDLWKSHYTLLEVILGNLKQFWSIINILIIFVCVRFNKYLSLNAN